jgi:FkbM family methyltransferase
MIFRKLHKMAKKRRTRQTIQRFNELTFNKGDVAIDCGANIGDITQQLADAGCEVYAFEPNEDAYAILSDRFASNQMVHLIKKGVSHENTTAKFYLHAKYEEDPIKYSQASSVLDSKKNIATDSYHEIELVRLSEFINQLEKPVRLLKLDVEGVEFEILDDLIDTGVIHKIDHVFCETHEMRIPELWAKLKNMKRRLSEENITHVHLDWM